jgi:2-polyprenyl-6-methoxyphenol hydroxylase-like FAD-dependent oxidoreductase
MPTESSPVLIIGAGPVGLSAALSLVQSGAPVRLIDRLAEPTTQSRAAIIHARTLELFERLGIVEDFLARGVKVHGAAIYGPGGKLLTHPNLDFLPTAYPYMLGLDQAETERLLTQRLAAHGTHVERQVELAGFEQTASAVRATLHHADGSESVADYAWVVGCDGARSTVRSALGMHLEGETLDTTWITADVKIRWDRPSDEAIAFLSSEGFAFIAPMNDDRWRVIVNVPKMTPAEAEKVTLDDVQTIVRERFGLDAPLYDPVWISPFSINTRLAPSMRVGRVFLAGDAAHVHSPVGGQGMNTGIQDALNLAWKLALVERGHADEALLESYDVERHGNAKRLLQLVGPATKFINLRNPVSVEVRNLAIRVVSQLGISAHMARNFSMLEVAYPDSPLCEEHGRTNHGPRAGERAPDAACVVTNEGVQQRLFECWKSDARHQLLVFAGRQQQGPRLAELQAFAQKLPADLVHATVIVLAQSDYAPDALIDSEGQAHEAYAAESGALYLVRPDGYVAFRGSLEDTDALLGYLGKWYPGFAL